MQLSRVWSQRSASKQSNLSYLFLFVSLHKTKRELLFILIYRIFLSVKDTGQVTGTLGGFNLLGGLSNGIIFQMNKEICIF